MKNLLGLALLAVVFGWGGTFEAWAQKVVVKKPQTNQSKLRAKDLYINNEDNNPATIGAEGMKVTVLLKRGNEKERFVSVNETFYSGDKIKLIFDLNFNGYAAIINVGPTGNESILFPYLENGRLIDHSFSAYAALQLPRGNAWIQFDKTTGTEQVGVIFSKTPIPELNDYQEAVTPGSDGRLANESEADQVLADLNSKSLTRGRSKDLTVQTEGNETYGVTPNGLGNQPVGFSFNLKHQ
jgi:hypothetical protein